jgi:hypothetical protein
MRLRRRERSAALAITLPVVALRIWVARKITFCGTPDSCYALGLAQSLARRHAFQAPFVFDLQLPALHVPNTGLEYWRPGVALLLYLLKPLGSLTLHGSLVVTTLAGVLWAVAAWRIAIRATGSRAVALASYTLCLLLPPAWESSLTPDPTLFYAAAIAWFLALFTVKRQGLLQDAVALLCVGAAYMIRNDAGLALIPLLVVLWLRRRAAAESRAQGLPTPPGSSPAYLAAMLAGFVLALAPMHLLYRHVLGAAFPPGASQALFLNDLSDFSSYGAPVGLHTLLSHGVKHLIAARIAAGGFILYRVLALVLGYTALIFLPTLWTGRRRTSDPISSDPRGPDEIGPARLPELAGGIAFAVTVLLVYSLVLPAVGVFSALRTSTALLPLVSVVVIVAIVRLARTRQLAVTLAGAVIAAYLVSGIMDDRREIAPMNAIGDAIRAQARGLSAMGAQPYSGAVIMTPDPVQFSVTTGYFAVPLPGNGLDAITEEALALQASDAILDGEHLPGTPDAIAQRLHPLHIATVPGQQVLLLELSPQRQQQR